MRNHFYVVIRREDKYVLGYYLSDGNAREAVKEMKEHGFPGTYEVLNCFFNDWYELEKE